MRDFLIDVDECLADFATPASALVSRFLGRPWSFDEAPIDDWDMFGGLEPEIKTAVHAAMDMQGFAGSLKPIPGSQDFVRELRKHCNVYALTAPHHTSAWWVLERNVWLGDLFGIDKRHIVHTDAKYLCRGDYFLDDHPGHVTRWSARHPGEGFWWATKHNARRLRGPMQLPMERRVSTWDEVLARVGV